MSLGATMSAPPAADLERRERLFFFSAAVVIAATVLVGFGSFAMIGISSFNSPWWVHVHAVTFVTWIVLFLSQTQLALRGAMGPHRRLGLAAAVWAVWMVLVGILLTPMTVAAGRSPPFFEPAFFLALDWVNIACFGALAAAGLYLRKHTDWHRRLMLCATISVIAPAWGRILVLADVMSVWSNVGMLLVYVAAAMMADWLIRGRVHPAYLWGFGAIFAMAPLITAVAHFGPVQALAARLVT